MYKKGISVILTAWNTQNYIEDCLDSIQKQTYFKHNDYEILLGIDNCEKTLNKVKAIQSKYKNLRVFYSEKNVGTYILSNTLSCIAQYEYIQRFDTDDIMFPDMLEKMVSHMEKRKGQILTGKLNMFSNVSDIGKNKPSYAAHGQILMRKETFMKFGGYRPFKCGADTEIVERIRKFAKYETYDKSTFYYRVHKESLTKKDSTGMISPYRKNIHQFIKWELSQKIKKESDAIIECVTADIKELVGEKMEHVSFEKPKYSGEKDLFEIWENMSDEEKSKYKKETGPVMISVSGSSNGYLRKKAVSGWNRFP
jgi:glycosyltransferase involved in cell wall biosynthesis